MADAEPSTVYDLKFLRYCGGWVLWARILIPLHWALITTEPYEYPNPRYTVVLFFLYDVGSFLSFLPNPSVPTTKQER